MHRVLLLWDCMGLDRKQGHCEKRYRPPGTLYLCITERLGGLAMRNHSHKIHCILL